MNQPNAKRLSFNSKPAARGARRSTTSLTPLIDVVFILLLFFMLASNFNQNNVIALDAPASGGSTSTVRGALLVNVRVTGIRVAGQQLSPDELVARIEQLRADNPGLTVLVRPATGVDLQQVVDVLDTLKKAGVANMSLMGRPGGG